MADLPFYGGQLTNGHTPVAGYSNSAVQQPSSGYVTPADANNGFTNDVGSGKGFNNNVLDKSNLSAPSSIGGAQPSSQGNTVQTAVYGNDGNLAGYRNNTTGIFTSINGKPDPNAGTTSPSSGTTTPNTGNGTISALGDQADRDALAQTQKDAQDAAKTFADTITNIQNGTVPLSPGEQAQVDGLKQQFQNMINQQLLTNSGASGLANVRGYQSGSAEYDPTFQAKTIGSIISAGNAKVADLNVKMASAVAELTQSLKDNDIAKIKESYDVLNNASKDRQAALQKTIDDTQKAIKDAQDKQQAITDKVDSIAAEAAKNGAPADVLKAISSGGSVMGAITAAGDYLQTATGTLGDYLQYKKDTEKKGLIPSDYQTYKDQQDAKAAKAKINEAYATEAAKNQADANSTGSDKVQQKLEQQYRTVLSKEFSSRTGSLGIENAKVNQANHLNSLFTQYYDPKTGNYNIPKTQYAELAMGLANLISPTGTVSDSARDAIMQKTAAGDFNGAIAYATGVPQNGSTQDVFKNLIDSVDRQAETAISNREAALQNMRDQAPTDLSQDRIDQLNKSTQMVSYAGQDRISKAHITDFLNQHGHDLIDTPDGKHSFYYLASQAATIPGSTPSSFESWLKNNNYIQ